MVRKPALEIFDIIDNVNLDHPPLRILLCILLIWAMIKSVLDVPDEIRHKMGCSEKMKVTDLKFQISNRESRGLVYEAKIKALIWCTNTVQVICIFGFSMPKKSGCIKANIRNSLCIRPNQAY